MLAGDYQDPKFKETCPEAMMVTKTKVMNKQKPKKSVVHTLS